MGVCHRHRVLNVLGVVLVLCVTLSCEDEVVTSLPDVVPDTETSIEWSIDAEADGFLGLVDAGEAAIAVAGRATYRFDGTSWTQIAAGISAHDISLATDGTLFALMGLSLYRRDSAAWTHVKEFQLDLEYPGLSAVWAFSSNQVFVTSHEEYDDGYVYFVDNTLHYFDGTSWRAVATMNGNGVYDMWGTSPNSVYLACNNGLYHYDGSGLTKVDAAGSVGIRRISGTSESDIFAIRSDRSILQFDGPAFAALPAPTTHALNDIRRIGGDLFVCGSGGACYRRAGGTWLPLNAAAMDDLTGVWGRSADEIITVGSGGIMRLDNGEWRRTHGFTPAFLFDIWVANTGEVFVVGENGVIEMRDAEGWRPMRFGESFIGMHGVSGTARDNVYAVGENGRILHYDGNVWTLMATTTSVTLNAVWANENTAVAVGGTTILKLENGTWNPMAAEMPARFILTDVWGASNGDLFAVGWITHEYNGTILHFDGTTWRPVDSEVRPRMFGVWGFAPDDVFAVGGGFPQDGPTRFWAAGIYHFDGVSWTRMRVTEDIGGLQSVWGTSHDDLVAVGSNYGLTLYDGKAWASELLDGLDGRGLNQIHGAEGTDLFGLGFNAVVRFHYPR